MYANALQHAANRHSHVLWILICGTFLEKNDCHYHYHLPCCLQRLYKRVWRNMQQPRLAQHSDKLVKCSGHQPQLCKCLGAKAPPCTFRKGGSRGAYFGLVVSIALQKVQQEPSPSSYAKVIYQLCRCKELVDSKMSTGASFVSTKQSHLAKDRQIC